MKLEGTHQSCGRRDDGTNALLDVGREGGGLVRGGYVRAEELFKGADADVGCFPAEELYSEVESVDGDVEHGVKPPEVCLGTQCAPVR